MAKPLSAQLFLDKFIAKNIVAFADDAEFVTKLKALTLDTFKIEDLDVPAAGAQRKAKVSSVVANFASNAADQTWTPSVLQSLMQIGKVIASVDTVAELQALDVPGLYTVGSGALHYLAAEADADKDGSAKAAILDGLKYDVDAAAITFAGADGTVSDAYIHGFFKVTTMVAAPTVIPATNYGQLNFND